MRKQATMTARLKFCALVLLLLAAAAAFTSCVTPVDYSGSLPWNAPASWEGQNLGVPL